MLINTNVNYESAEQVCLPVLKFILDRHAWILRMQ